MQNKFHTQIICLGLIALMCSSCSYIQTRQEQAKLTHIQNDISVSTLDQVNEFTSRAPFTKTYEFEFRNSEKTPYALVFYLNESDFSNSVIKHRKPNELHRNAVRIDEAKEVLTILNKNLPNPETVPWPQVSKQIEKNDARDGYYVLQEYIRYKIRDL